jgi:ArsR family transcriptional regulator, arsenate/arsenite/antimonite-responsive transcriptional repressor
MDSPTTRAQATAADRLAALRALADPVRLALVDELARADACACELRERLDLSAPLISHHLRVLREAGLVHTRKAGRRLEVELDRETLARVAGSLLGRRAA